MSLRILTLFFILAPFQAWAQQEQSDVDNATSDPRNVFPQAGEIGGSEILVARDEYLTSRGWSLGPSIDNPSGAYIGWGTASIQVSSSSKDYGKARVAAVDSAILNAVGEFTLSLGRDTVTETVREIFQDPGALSRQSESGFTEYYEAISDRMRSASVAQLDRLLEELGENPDQFADLDLSRKVDLARESVSKSIVRTAAKSFNGIRVVATFEEENQVGALVIHHQRLRDLARDIVEGNFVALGDGFSRGPIKQALDELEGDEILFVHGLRVLKDDHGNRVLLAFGQASVNVTRADSEMRQSLAINAADRESDMRADAFISEFLNSFVEVDERTLSESVARISAQLEGSRSREQEIAAFSDALSSLVRQRSESSLTGVVTVEKWRKNHPDTGHLYVGTVKAWSPATDAAFTQRLRQSMGGDSVAGEAVEVKVRQSEQIGDEDW